MMFDKYIITMLCLALAVVFYLVVLSVVMRDKFKVDEDNKEE